MSKSDYGLFIVIPVTVVVFFGAAMWFSREPVMQELPAAILHAPPTGAGGNAQPTSAGEAFHYYPGQYQNRATEPSAHIEAF